MLFIKYRCVVLDGQCKCLIGYDLSPPPKKNLKIYLQCDLDMKGAFLHITYFPHTGLLWQELSSSGYHKDWLK